MAIRRMVQATELPLVIAALTDAAEAAWPVFRIDRADFGARLRAAIDSTAPNAVAAVSSIHVADLYLACACAQGVTTALSEFATQYLSGIDVYLKQFGNTSVRSEDVRAELEDTLLFGRRGSPPRIGQYTGRGPLQRFVRTAARNIAVTMLRGQKRVVEEDFDALASQLVCPPVGSENMVAARYEAVVREALRAALLMLDRRERTIVRLHMVQGVSQTQIARMLTVNQSTVSRSFDKAMHVIHVEIRRQLEDLEGMSPSEMKSIIRDVRSRIDLSLSRILRSTHGA